MKYKSKVAKGSRFERFIAKEIMAEGLGKATREHRSGAGLNKADIRANIPFLLECKNQKKIEWWKSIDQAKEQADKGNWAREKWGLVIRDTRTPEHAPDVYAVIDFWEFLKLLKKDSEPLIKKPDRKMKWDLVNLKDAINRVIKNLQ